MDQNDKMNFLANSLKQAREVMKRVDSNLGNTPGGNSIRRSLSEDDVDELLDTQEYITEDQLPQNRMPQQPQQRDFSKSKLPPEILRSFAEMPAIDPTQPVGMELLMNKIAEKATPQKPKIQENRLTNNQTQVKTVKEVVTPQLDTKLIEYIIKKTVEETLAQVSKRTDISENIQIKIGDKSFNGKITSLNEIKTTKK